MKPSAKQHQTSACLLVLLVTSRSSALSQKCLTYSKHAQDRSSTARLSVNLTKGLGERCECLHRETIRTFVLSKGLNGTSMYDRRIAPRTCLFLMRRHHPMRCAPRSRRQPVLAGAPRIHATHQNWAVATSRVGASRAGAWAPSLARIPRCRKSACVCSTSAGC